MSHVDVESRGTGRVTPRKSKAYAITNIGPGFLIQWGKSSGGVAYSPSDIG